MAALVPYAGAAAAVGLGVLGNYANILTNIQANYESVVFRPVVTRGGTDTAILTTPEVGSRRPRSGPSWTPHRSRKRLFPVTAANLARSMPPRTALTTRYKRRRFKNASIGRVAYKKVRRLENSIEKKAFVNVATLSVPAPTGSGAAAAVTEHLSAIAGGNTGSTRVGLNISPRMLTINMCLRNPDSNPHCVRIVIVQTIGLDTVPFNYFSPPAIAGGATFKFLAPKGIENQFRFRTLYDNIIALSAGVTTNFPVMLRLSKLKRVSWNGTAAGDVASGGIYLMALRDNQITLATNMIIDIDWKLTYTDC